MTIIHFYWVAAAVQYLNSKSWRMALTLQRVGCCIYSSTLLLARPSAAPALPLGHVVRSWSITDQSVMFNLWKWYRLGGLKDAWWLFFREQERLFRWSGDGTSKSLFPLLSPTDNSVNIIQLLKSRWEEIFLSAASQICKTIQIKFVLMTGSPLEKQVSNQSLAVLLHRELAT